MDIWASSNTNNIFKGNFFWSNYFEEIMTTEMVSGPLRVNSSVNKFLNIRLCVPDYDDEFVYEK